MNQKYYVYFYYNKNGDLLYIGQAKEGVYERWQSHNDIWKDEVFTIGVREYEDEAIMDVFESYYIKRFPTKYNIARLNHGYTERDIKDTSTLKKYSIDEFCAEYAPKEKTNTNLTLNEKIEQKGIKFIETNKIDLFNENFLSNTNLDKIWFKYENYVFLFEFADISYRRKKGEPEEFWLSNKKLLSFKKAVCAMGKQGLDVTAQQYNFDSVESEEYDSLEEKFVSFDKFNLKIFLLYKNKSVELKRKSITSDITVGYREQLKIYEEENNNVIYLISSEFCRNSMYQPQYYTVKDFIEISADNFIIDLERFKKFYLPNKDKSEKDSYEKINSEAFKKHLEQINQIKSERYKKQKDEEEKEAKKQKNAKEIKNAYWSCVKYLKKFAADEKKFLKKVTRFDYSSSPETTYSLEEIETIEKKMYGCCSLKQYNYIKSLAIKWGLTIKPNVFIFKKEASKLIQILKDNSVDNYQNNTIDKFFESI